MAAVFQPVRIDAADHYADLPLAQAWLADAAAQSAPGELARLDGRPPAEQIAQLKRMAGSLSSAYRALNVSPHREETYRNAWQGAYGFAGGRTPAYDAREVTYLETTRGAGWMATRVMNIAALDGVGERAANVVSVRGVLLSDGRARLRCLFTEDTTDDLCERFGEGVLHVGRAAPTGGCASPEDWRCAAWNDPPVQDLWLLPPSRWTAEFFGQVAAALAADPRAALERAVRAARGAGYSPTISGAAGARPTHTVQDNPRTVRPRTPPPRAPLPGVGTGGGAVVVIDPSGIGGSVPLGGGRLLEAQCSQMPGMGEEETCGAFFRADPARAERLIRAALAADLFGDRGRGADLGPLTWEQLREIARQPLPEQAAAWRRAAWASCALPPSGFTTDAARQAWMAANPWCDPARVPGVGIAPAPGTVNPQRLQGGMSRGTKIALAVVAGGALVAGGVYVARRATGPRRSRRSR